MKIQLERREKIDVLGFLQGWQDDGDGVGRALTMLTFPVLFRTLETVPWDTPASLAISLMVGTGSSPFFADGLFYDNILNGQKLQEKK